MMEKQEDTAVIDLFCGIGGLSQGFVLEGFNVIAGYDNVLNCKFAYEKNNFADFYHKDVTTISGNELNNLFGEKFKILIGCAPCQPFSSYSFKIKEKDKDKVNLLYEFSRLIKECLPDIVSMENVPQLLDFNKSSVFNDFIKVLSCLDYNIDYKIVYCPDYGIPQTRKRLVLLASRLGNISLIEPTHSPKNYTTVRDTIGELRPVKAGEYDKKDPLHRARALSALNIKRLQHTKEGGGWKTWPKELLPECFKRKSGKTYGSVYGRMKWNEPAPTMTTHCTGLGNGRFGHPQQDRAITLREAALLQTFPENYQFFESMETYNSSIICKQIGNAVPPMLGRIVAQSIKEHLKKHKLWK